MRKLLNKKYVCAIIALILVVSMAGGYLFNSRQASASKTLTAKERLQAKRNETMASVSMNEADDENEVVRAVVSLKRDSVMETVEDSTTEYSKKLKKQENKILDSQENIIKKAEKITGNEVVSQTAYLVNSFSIDSTRKELKELAKLAGVEKVYESNEYTPQMNNAVENTGVKKEWEAKEYGYAGEGTVVAIIDSGVNYEHQDMVLDKDVKSKYTKEEWEEKIKLLGYGSYKTDKVPFAYNYMDYKNDCIVENPNSYGIYKSSMCHGYHVSGIAAANGEIKGVAKNAQVLGMQVFGNNMNVCMADSIIRAIEDAVKLGADVINMSLGVGIVGLDDMEYIQEAVNKASEAGVVSCISAANDGTSSGLELTSNELERVDTSTLNTPSTAKSSLSVAAATNNIFADENDEDDKNATIDSNMDSDIDDETIKNEQKMADFSSWGPATDLTLKPEIAAPGEEIYSTLEGKDKYCYMSGTSMASPFIAGSTALLKSAVNAKNLGLEGKELNQYLKNCLMNTADPMIDTDRNVPYSVRYQGAGMVDAYGAVNNNVIATVNGEAKVELREMRTNKKTFVITLKNYGEVDASYVLNKVPVYTDKTVNTDDECYYGIEPVKGSDITFNVSNVTVPAKGSVTVNATVQLGSGFLNNKFVESFITFEGQGVENIGLPVLGFFGDWSKETIIDKSIYDEGTSVLEDYLSDEKLQSLTGLKANKDTKLFYGTDFIKEKNIVPDLDWEDEEELDDDDLEDEDLDDEEILERIKNNIGKDAYNALIKSGIPKKVLCGDKKAVSEFVSKGKKTFGPLGVIKKNKTTAIKNVSNGYGVALFNPNGWKYYNLNIKTENMVEYYILDLKDLLYLSDENKEIASGDFNKEIGISDNDFYFLLIRKLDSTTKGDIIADVTITESDGSNCYINKKVYDGEKVAFSPNADGINDIVVPSTTNLRSTSYNNIYVLDSNKKKIRTLAKNINSSKVIIRNELLFENQLTTPFEYDDSNYVIKNGYVNWDGKLYDSTKGEYVTAKEGQYYIQIESKMLENSLPQVVTMPVKIDDTKPVVEKYEVKEENNDTIVTFKVKDDISLSPYYYIDTACKVNNVSKTATYANKFVNTLVNEAGEYEVNLGNISDSKVTLMFEDQAGNEVFVTDEIKEDVNNKIDEDDTSTDNVNEDSLNEDKEAPVINVVENKRFEKMITREDEISILLKKKLFNSNKFQLQIKVTDENLDENSFAIVLDSGSINNVKVDNNGNGLYTLTFTKIDYISTFNVSISDKKGNVASKNIVVYKNIFKHIGSYFSDESNIILNNNDTVLTRENLNSDGTYTISGKVDKSIDSLKLNNQNIEIDNTTREFSINVPIKKGANVCKFTLVENKEQYDIYKTLYYDEINILIDTNNINMGKNTVIKTSKNTVRLKGQISSYISLSSINVNNENIYSNIYGKTSTDGNEITVPFDTTVKLHKGMNKVLIEAKNMVGQVEQFIVTINYQ